MSKVWSLKAVSFSFGGLSPDLGDLSDDDVIIVEYNDAASKSEGAGGGEVINLLAGGIKSVKLKLHQTAAYNSILSAAYQIQQKAADGTGLAPLSVIDTLGATVIISAVAAIQKMPDWSAGKEVKPVEWIFLPADSESFIGGH